MDAVSYTGTLSSCQFAVANLFIHDFLSIFLYQTRRLVLLYLLLLSHSYVKISRSLSCLSCLLLPLSPQLSFDLFRPSHEPPKWVLDTYIRPLFWILNVDLTNLVDMHAAHFIFMCWKYQRLKGSMLSHNHQLLSSCPCIAEFLITDMSTCQPLTCVFQMGFMIPTSSQE